MAFTIILFTVSLLAVTSGFVWQGEQPGFGRFPFQPMYMYGMPLPNPPPLPKIPGFNLPQPPPLPIFNPPFMHQFPTFQMPPFPTIELPPLPTVDDIKNTKPEPGQVYNGVYVSSHSNSKYDKDGNLIRDGGGTILVNNNGEVIEEKFGNGPSTEQPNVVPVIFQMPVHIPPIVMPPFQQPFFKPIDPDFIRNAVPKGTETFSGVSTSSHSYSSDIDGVKSSGGGVNSITNDNGKVNENTIEFSKNDA